MNIPDVIGVVYTVFSPLILLAILTIVLIGFVIISAILVFHWDRYGTNSRTNIWLKVTFFGGAAVFISLAIFSIILY